MWINGREGGADGGTSSTHSVFIAVCSMASEVSHPLFVSRSACGKQLLGPVGGGLVRLREAEGAGQHEPLEV